MILLWGLPTESPLAAVRRALEAAGRPAVIVNQRRPLALAVEYTDGGAAGGVEGELRVGRAAIDLAGVTGVYVRPYDPGRIPEVAAAGERSATWEHAHAFHEAFRSYTEIAGARVLNRLSAMASNSSKPYQAALIAEAGFDVPETIVTTDAEAVRELAARAGAVIYKSVSGVRSRVTRLSPERLAALELVAHCPTQFQALVPGHDVRVHVVGDELFATEIRSPADDYRYARGEGQPLDMRPTLLPDDVAARALRLTAALGLETSGIDLRVTPEGRWCCFEVNPSPGFTFFDPEGAPIAASFARWLDGAAAAHPLRRTA